MSKLKSNSLTLNNKEIFGVETTLTNDNTKIPTSKALYDYLKSRGIKPFPPISLSVSGSWTNPQYNKTRPDLTGLTFTATYADGSSSDVTNNVNVLPITWNAEGTQTATFSYTIRGVTVTTTSSVGVNRTLESLSVSGNWSNTQFYNEAPNIAGLTFTATYNSDETATITPSQIAVSPNKWGGTGAQTATFSYTEGPYSASTTKTANVTRKLVALNVSGNWSNTQFYNEAPNIAGLTFTASYNNGTTATIASTNINVSPNAWGATGTQTATFSYTENGITKTTTKSVDVTKKLSSLSVSGSWSNTQWTNTAPDTTGLTFTANYNNGTSATVTPSISPSTWSGTAGSQTATFSYAENGITKTTTKSATVVRKLTGLSVGGSWSKIQYTNQAVDYTGLSFTASYNNGTTATVTPSRYSPTTWGSTVGTQTCTFYYSENGIEKNANSSVSVADGMYITPLTVQARGAGTVRITKTGDPGTIYYSINGGSQTVLDKSRVDISVSTGDRVSFYRTLSADLSESKYFTINCTNNCYVYGNFMSLCNKDNFTDLTTIDYKYVAYRLFYNNSHININESVGKLLLPATTLAYGCYQYMFAGCTGLTTAPVLPATTLATQCYYSMFSRCTGLTTAPVLSATTLASQCYERMFYGCTGLTTAPVLPATTLASTCYQYMFYECTNLTSITCLATTFTGNYCTYRWVEGVASSGTFYKNSAMSSWTTGNDGIPSGWAVRNA